MFRELLPITQCYPIQTTQQLTLALRDEYMERLQLWDLPVGQMWGDLGARQLVHSLLDVVEPEFCKHVKWTLLFNCINYDVLSVSLLH